MARRADPLVQFRKAIEKLEETKALAPSLSEQIDVAIAGATAGRKKLLLDDLAESVADCREVGITQEEIAANLADSWAKSTAILTQRRLDEEKAEKERADAKAKAEADKAAADKKAADDAAAEKAKADLAAAGAAMAAAMAPAGAAPK